MESRGSLNRGLCCLNVSRPAEAHGGAGEELPLLQHAGEGRGREPALLCEGGCDGELPLLSTGLSGCRTVPVGLWRLSGQRTVPTGAQGVPGWRTAPVAVGGARVEPVLSRGVAMAGNCPTGWELLGARPVLGLLAMCWTCPRSREGRQLWGPPEGSGPLPLCPQAPRTELRPLPEVGPKGEFGGGLICSWPAGQSIPQGRGHPAEEGRGTSGRQLDGRQPAVYRGDT